MSHNYTNQSTAPRQSYMVQGNLIAGDYRPLDEQFGTTSSSGDRSASATKAVATAFIITTASISGSAIYPYEPVWRPIATRSSSKASSSMVGGEVSDAAELADLTERYNKLATSIEHLGQLKEDESLHLDEETVAYSLEFVRFLRDFNVPPPQIFPHGGDALIFEWRRDGGMRYVTYEEYMARLRDHGNQTEYRNPLKLDLRQETDVATLIRALGGKQWRVKRSTSSI